MNIQLKSTSKIVNINNVPARVWEEKTESGIPVHAFITRVVVDRDQDCSEFEKELEEHQPPSADIQAYPLHLIL